ncbi:MAG: glycosyltransferase [Cyclobacteriaceae bacterium]
MASPKYSVIIPVFNRPNEIDELLESLTHQTYKDFEILVIEDGSTISCQSIVDSYKSSLSVTYFFKENTGQGFSRNFGFERATGEWLIVFDSDCIIPQNYFQEVNDFLELNNLDAYGGPDKAAKDFTLIQRAISYSMTSFFTTGGIRGGKKRLGAFHPRSFNMGIRKEVFDKTKGYILPKKGEDIEFSIRIIENGFKTGLIPEAFVYHKRRTNFTQFFTQLHFFGTARINVFRFYKNELKLVHLFPSLFLIGSLVSLVFYFVIPFLGMVGLMVYVVYAVLILIDAIVRTKNLLVGLLAVVASFVQLIAYGLGLMKEGLIYLLRG